MSIHSSNHFQAEQSAVSFLYDALGKRKYLTVSERRAFLHVAKETMPPRVATFCATLVHTGVRISEALELAPARVDLDSGIVIARSLKKRRGGVYRAIPVPTEYINELELVHSIRDAQTHEGRSQRPIWTWCRTTGWQLVKKAMHLAEIQGPQATPKGLRHGFAIAALQSGVPLNVVSKWLGHSRLQTTAIYADAVGDEEQAFAERMWTSLQLGRVVESWR